MIADDDKKMAIQIATGVVDFLKKIKKEETLGSVIEILQKEKQSKKALVYAPVDLKVADKKKISMMVARLTGEKIESFVFHKDESLIDGLKVFYKDRLWDFSVSSQIKKLEKVN
jgi:F0F1-type ATP synthase delta subunit